MKHLLRMINELSEQYGHMKNKNKTVTKYYLRFVFISIWDEDETTYFTWNKIRLPFTFSWQGTISPNIELHDKDV